METKDTIDFEVYEIRNLAVMTKITENVTAGFEGWVE